MKMGITNVMNKNSLLNTCDKFKTHQELCFDRFSMVCVHGDPGVLVGVVMPCGDARYDVWPGGGVVPHVHPVIQGCQAAARRLQNHVILHHVRQVPQHVVLVKCYERVGAGLPYLGRKWEIYLYLTWQTEMRSYKINFLFLKKVFDWKYLASKEKYIYLGIEFRGQELSYTV